MVHDNSNNNDSNIPILMALFDIRVVDTNVWSYCAHTPRDVLCTAEGDEKKGKYLQICQDRRATFTPTLCFCRWHAWL